MASRLAACLILLAAVGSGVAQAQTQEVVTITHYALRGITYSGQPVGPGVAACSWRWPLGTRFRLEDGSTVVCLDRGSGLGASHLDLWTESVAEARRLGRYQATVEVLP